MNRWAARYGFEKTGKEILDKAKKGNNGRYAAVNLMNYATIEFRLFRGTLKYNTLIAAIELVNEIDIDWIKSGQLYKQWQSGNITAVEFQKQMGLRANTFYRRLKEYKKSIYK